MGNITLKQFDGSSVSPRDDAILYNTLIRESGIFSGLEITHLGANVLRIKEGRGIIKGRLFDLLEQTVNCNLAESGVMKGRLYLSMDLSNTETPLQIKTAAASVLPELVQEEDCNYTNGKYEIELCTYDVTDMAISNVKTTYKMVDAQAAKEATEAEIEAIFA